MIRRITFIGLLAVIFTIPWENAITVNTLGTLTRVIGIGTAGMWIMSVIIEGKIRKLRFVHISAFLFAAINIVSIFWTVDHFLTFERVKTYAQLMVLSWMLWDLTSTPEKHRFVWQVFILGGYVAIFSALSNFMSGQLISEYEYGRFSGANQNAVEFAMILSASFPMAWNLAMTQEAGRFWGFWRILNIIYIPASLFTIVLTASRTALIAVIPGSLYIIGTFTRVKWSVRLLILTILIIGIFVGQSYVPQVTIERLGTIGTSVSSGDFGGRMKLWLGAIDIFLKNPILGIGSYTLEAPGQLGAFAHNSFLSVLAELGIVGFCFFTGWVVLVFLCSINQSKPYAIISFTVFLIWLISVQTSTWEFSKPTWFFLNIIVISAAIYPRKKEQPEGGSVSVSQPASPDTLLGGMNS